MYEGQGNPLNFHVGADHPYASLEAARDGIRTSRGADEKGGRQVIVHGGDYLLEKAFTLTSEDSGTPKDPVVYRAAQGERVRLLGGRILDSFTAIEDATILDRLCPKARTHVRQCDLKEIGIDDFGHFSRRGFGCPVTPAHMELFFLGRRMQVARWPDRAWTHIERPATITDDDHGGELGVLEAGFYYSDPRPENWIDLEEVWMHGYWGWEWANSYEQIQSFNPETGLIRTRAPYGLYGFRAGARFYFVNVAEELDIPGEYYVDARRGCLYFWPPGDLEGGEAAVSVVEEPLIQIHGASHVRFEGFTVEYGRASGIEITEGECVSIRDCTVRNLGNHGISVEDGKAHEVVGCEVCNCGDSGISLRGGDRANLERGGHLAAHNHVHDIAEWSRCYQPGIRVMGVGHRVEHNHIHDSPHNAILLSGNEHLIEFNHIHHVCLETGDVGAFYMGRDWSERGNILRYNFFHDIYGIGMGSRSVYLDDCASGTTIFGNIFFRCARAVFIGGGRDNRVENNVFVECDPAVQIDGRGLDRKSVWADMVDRIMKERLDEMNHREPPYSDRYPELAGLDPHYTEGTGVPPEGNEILRNICLGSWIEMRWNVDPDIIAVEGNLIDEDLLFLDSENLNFQLREDSPAYALGFQRIPFEEIGPRHDASVLGTD